MERLEQVHSPRSDLVGPTRPEVAIGEVTRLACLRSLRRVVATRTSARSAHGGPADRDKTLSRFCPAWKSKNFVSRARNTPLRSVFLSAWEAKVSWSCPARPAGLGFHERLPDFFRPPKYLEPGPS